jgi:hypothetical protein
LQGDTGDGIRKKSPTFKAGDGRSSNRGEAKKGSGGAGSIDFRALSNHGGNGTVPEIEK